MKITQEMLANGLPIRITHTGIVPPRIGTTITDANTGEILEDVKRVVVVLDAYDESPRVTAQLTLYRYDFATPNLTEEVVTTNNVQLDIDAIAHYVVAPDGTVTQNVPVAWANAADSMKNYPFFATWLEEIGRSLGDVLGYGITQELEEVPSDTHWKQFRLTDRYTAYIKFKDQTEVSRQAKWSEEKLLYVPAE